MNTSDGNDSYVDFYNQAQFITGLILYPIICGVGITGNILTLVVLSHRKMLSSTNVYLSALAVADLFKLFNDMLYVIVSILMRTHPFEANQMMGLMYPISHYILNQSVCVSSWLTVCVGVERYIAVCHPARAKEMCTVKRARNVSIIVFILMSAIAIPSGLKYRGVIVNDPVTNQTKYDLNLTELGNNESFMTVYTWIINLLRSVIPLCILIFVNACIIQSLRKERVKGKKMSARNRITLMLIIVIIVFVLCISPDAIMSTVFGFGYVEAGYLVKGIREFTDTLLLVNSAVNFIIYCLCSKIFRDVFSEIFCTADCRRCLQRQRGQNYTEIEQRPTNRSQMRKDVAESDQKPTNKIHMKKDSIESDQKPTNMSQMAKDFTQTDQKPTNSTEMKKDFSDTDQTLTNRNPTKKDFTEVDQTTQTVGLQASDCEIHDKGVDQYADITCSNL